MRDYIGIGYPGETTPDSGLYVTQLPGVSLKSIDKIANEDQITFSGVWNDVQKRSLKKFDTAIINYFARKFQLRRIHEDMQLPNAYIHSVEAQTAKAAVYRGFTYDLGFQASPLAKIHIEELQLFVLASDLPIPGGNVTVKVWEFIDYQNGNLLAEYTFTNVVAGWNTLKVNKDYEGVWKIFVGYDAMNITGVWNPLNNNLGMFAQQSIFQYEWPTPCRSWLWGANSTTNDYPTLVELNNTFGLSATIGTRCFFDVITCSMKQLFSTAWWYCLGAELMIERMYSDRLNRYTTIDLKRAEALRYEFENIYQTELKAVMDGIDLVTWDCCLDCNAQVQLVHSIP